MKTMLNKIKLTAFLLLITLIGFGQELPKEKSDNHVQVKGTNIFMIPPATFEPATKFKGFKNPGAQRSMIAVIEIPGPYSEIIKVFNAEDMKAKGMLLKNKKEIKVADFDGIIIGADHPVSGVIFSKEILIYGNEKSSTMINGVYLKDSIMLGEKIKESILSIVLDTKLKCAPREGLDYSVNEKVGSLKLNSVVGNGMIFTRDLKMPTESADKALLITARSFANVDISDKKLFCVSSLKRYSGGFSVIENKGINEIEIDNIKGYELFGENNDNKEMYQVILFDNEGGYFVLAGTYIANCEEARTDIKRIIGTFHRK